MIKFRYNFCSYHVPNEVRKEYIDSFMPKRVDPSLANYKNLIVNLKKEAKENPQKNFLSLQIFASHGYNFKGTQNVASNNFDFK